MCARLDSPMLASSRLRYICADTCPLDTDFTEFLAEFSGTGLDDRQYLGSFFGHLRASHNHDSFGALGVEGLDQGPFSGCPVCSATASGWPTMLRVTLFLVIPVSHRLALLLLVQVFPLPPTTQIPPTPTALE